MKASSSLDQSIGGFWLLAGKTVNIRRGKMGRD
jgi:hypothetical protein